MSPFDTYQTMKSSKPPSNCVPLQPSFHLSDYLTTNIFWKMQVKDSSIIMHFFLSHIHIVVSYCCQQLAWYFKLAPNISNIYTNHSSSFSWNWSSPILARGDMEPCLNTRICKWILLMQSSKQWTNSRLVLTLWQRTTQIICQPLCWPYRTIMTKDLILLSTIYAQDSS